ncbi:uncharacterized protein LOC143646487 isoform X2 [Tamandua tetradactyla]|uniref:uncharacterized protein LOC143646487 isoform X2 n=1 Tax=Tamandua tetradactyla TaxID=48850 RepID=UPI0040541FB1
MGSGLGLEQSEDRLITVGGLQPGKTQPWRPPCEDSTRKRSQGRKEAPPPFLVTSSGLWAKASRATDCSFMISCPPLLRCTPSVKCEHGTSARSARADRQLFY